MTVTLAFCRDGQAAHAIDARYGPFLCVLARHFGWEGFPDLPTEPIENLGCRKLIPAAEAKKFGRALKAALPHIPEEDASHIYHEYLSKTRQGASAGELRRSGFDAPRDVFVTCFTPSDKEGIRRLAEFCLQGAFEFETLL
jgi:hypothetical protein